MSGKHRRNAGAMPVSAHRAFPAIVALWFAALLGIGSMVLPVTVFERLAETSGLSSVIAAAQAPFGMTARVTIAVIAAVLGAFAGLAIARRVAASGAIASEISHPDDFAPFADAPVKRPISALEEFGLAGFEADDAEEPPHSEQSTGIERDSFVPEETADAEAFAFAPAPAAIDHDRGHPEETQQDEPLVSEGAWVAQAQNGPSPAPSEHSEEVPMTGFEPRTADPVVGADTATIPIVELVERFARALERHRADERTGENPADPGHLDDFEDETDAAGDGYPSLLAMKGPFAPVRDPARIRHDTHGLDNANEPVVAFPGQAASALRQPAASAHPAAHGQTRDTERALRDALEKLQRMSGAA